MKILGTDPGGTTGWGAIELSSDQRPKINLVDFGQVKNEEELEQWIEWADICVIEFFRIRPDKVNDFVFKDLHASEAIGVIKMLCRKYNTRIEMQGSDRKPMGFAWAGMKYTKGKKGTHQQDGIAHAVYYACKNLHAIPLAK